MNITALLIYISVMSLTPGPNNLMCLYLGAKSGFKGAICFMSGSMTGLLIKSVLCGLLNLVLAEKIPLLVPYLKWIGFAYMLYLAFSMVASAVHKKEDTKQSGESSFGSGILLQVLNVKSWIAALSIFSVYVIPYTTSISTIVMIALVFTFVAAVTSAIWCGFGTAIQRVYHKYQLLVGSILAATLVYCAISAVI